MPPRRRSCSGYRGVRARPNGTFYAEIQSDDEHIGLRTFETAHEAARAYDAAEALTATAAAITRDARQHERELEQRLVIAERDERMCLEWARRFPEDVAVEEAFYAEKEEAKAMLKAAKKHDREARRAKKEAKKKEKEEKVARKEEEKKNGAGPSTLPPPISTRLPKDHPLKSDLNYPTPTFPHYLLDAKPCLRLVSNLSPLSPRRQALPAPPTSTYNYGTGPPFHPEVLMPAAATNLNCCSSC
ncbi:hypothetical protein QYE76_024404 [Lolium multiflorum]|uniref:AP2/ERF domain-containing protein n=1 Tax=Lolium multiflorum TaxID=4521 RepID=A0AAD8VT96_LOLMU|nr:hypothetical protein QYE76_024404 [Lolium multiflorum]